MALRHPEVPSPDDRERPRAPRRQTARIPFDSALGAVGVLTIVALALRLPHIGESLVGDEMYAYAEVHNRGFTEVFERVREGGENSPPLFFALAWLSMKLGGDSTVLIRLPSLVLGTALVPLVYVLGLRTVGRRAGLIASLLVTLSPFAIYFSSEARPYATLAFLVALSTLLLLAALDSRQRRWWVLYAIVGSLSLYAHYFAVFPLMAQGAWALVTHRDYWRPLLLANAGIVLGFIPGLLIFLDQKGNSISILAFYAPLTWRGAARELLRLFPGHPSFVPAELPGTGFVWLVWVAIGVAPGSRAGGPLARRRPPRPPARLVLVALLALATPIGFTIYSALGPEVFIGRYMNGALPFLALTIGAVLAAAPRAVGLAATAVVAGCLALGAVAVAPGGAPTPGLQGRRALHRPNGPAGRRRGAARPHPRRHQVAGHAGRAPAQPRRELRAPARPDLGVRGERHRARPTRAPPGIRGWCWWAPRPCRLRRPGSRQGSWSAGASAACCRSR